MSPSIVNIFYDGALKQPLLAFAFSFFLLTIMWSEVRRMRYAHVAIPAILEKEHNNLLKKLKAYKILALFFITTVICFSWYPYLYSQMGPISFLKLPVLNLFGLALLACSILIAILTQMDIDKEVHISILASKEPDVRRLSVYASRMASCYFLMFLGVSLILANCVELLLFCIACGLYMRYKLPV